MKTYRLKKWYPSLPRDWEEKEIIIVPDNLNKDVYKPICDKCTIEYLFKKEVESNPEFWEEALNYSIGKWYKTNNNDLFYITDIVDNHIIGYGLSTFNIWIYNVNIHITKDKEIILLEEATEKEVNDRLLQYAIKNYPEGTKFHPAYFEIQKNIEVVDHIRNEVIYNKIETKQYGYYLYYKGHWANIVEKPLFKDKNGKFWYKSDFKAGKFVNREKPIYNYKKELKALKKLLIERDKIREGWKPDCNNPKRTYFALFLNKGKWTKYKSFTMDELFVFSTEEKRDKFLEENKKVLEKIKPLYK